MLTRIILIGVPCLLAAQARADEVHEKSVPFEACWKTTVSWVKQTVDTVSHEAERTSRLAVEQASRGGQSIAIRAQRTGQEIGVEAQRIGQDFQSAALNIWNTFREAFND